MVALARKVTALNGAAEKVNVGATAGIVNYIIVVRSEHLSLLKNVDNETTEAQNGVHTSNRAAAENVWNHTAEVLQEANLRVTFSANQGFVMLSKMPSHLIWLCSSRTKLNSLMQLVMRWFFSLKMLQRLGSTPTVLDQRM